MEQVPYRFTRSSVEFRGRTGQKIVDSYQNWAFPDCYSTEFTDGFEIMHTAWHGIEQVPYCFARSSIKFEGHMRRKINDFNPISVRLLGLWQKMKI